MIYHVYERKIVKLNATRTKQLLFEVFINNK